MAAIRKIEIGADGMPSDPEMRRLAVRIKHHMRARPLPGHPKHLLQNLFPKARLADVKAVWRALVAAGTVIEDARGFRFVSKGRLEPVDTAARKANFDAVVRGVAARACSSPEAVARCETLFRQARTLYGVHRADAGGATAVVVPVRIEMKETGPAIAEAFAVLVTPGGLRAASLPERAIRQRFEGDRLVLSIHPGGCAPDPEMQLLLEGAPISPFTSRPSDLANRAARLARKSILPLARARQECSRFLGEELSPAAWKSFAASLRQVPPLAMMFRRVLFGALDPDLRRAAMRNPVADANLYGWLCGGDRGRRLQASAAFPVLTQRLPQVEDAIDAGRELLPAMSRALGLPVPVLRRISGLTWQKLGPHFRILVESEQGDDLSSLLAQVSPEKVPSTRAGWHAAAQAAENLGRAFGWPCPGTLALAASRDWEAFDRLVDGGFIHAVEDTAEALTAALTGVWTERHGPDRAVARVVAEAVSGKDGGLKRLASFSDRWHRGVGRRTASMKALRRRIFGEALVSWRPLTAPDAFMSRHGTLEWLCDDDALAEEGAEMRHCVGSYSWACVSGRSHIAAVTSEDGTRSTVEIASDGGRIEVVQHRAAWNSDPSPGCEAVVKDFLAAVRSGLETAERSGSENLEDTERFFLSAEEMGVNLSDSEAREILAIYADCLPSQARELDLADWRRLLGAAGAFREAHGWQCEAQVAA